MPVIATFRRLWQESQSLRPGWGTQQEIAAKESREPYKKRALLLVQYYRKKYTISSLARVQRNKNPAHC